VSALVATIAVAGVLAGGFVAAMAVSRWALASAARADAEADELADAGVSMVPFGELPEPAVRVVMARRALVLDVNDLEGRN
jgi:hypothetical protein